MEDSADGTGLEDEEDVEKHFKSDFDETGSMTSQDDVEGRGGGGTEHSGYHSEDGSDDVENSDEVSVIEDVAAPQHTNYTADPPEVSLDIYLKNYLRLFQNYFTSDPRRRREEKRAERQKELEAKRAAKKGPMKLGGKKMID